MSNNMLNLLNGFSTMKFVAESLNSVNEDPMRGVIGVSAYLNGVDQLVSALRSIRDSLGTQGISFDFNENMIITMLDANKQ
jgi:hypothetical protein